MNIRKIFDIIHATEQDDVPGIILQADIQKAFDRVEMNAIVGTLEYMGFATYIIEWINILYDNFTIKVQNNGYLSEEIAVQRSVHQGGPCSAAIFVCVIEMLSIRLKEDQEIKGLYIKDIENLINQFADDTDLALDAQDDDSFKKALEKIEELHQTTGLKLNYDKMNVYRIGSLRNSNARFYSEKRLHWTNEPINVLGVDVSTDIKQAIDLNYSRIVKKAINVLNKWRRQKLSLLGKISIVNTLVSLLFTYAMSVLPNIPEKVVKIIEKEVSNYLWNGSKPKIPMYVLQMEKSDGGYGLINL